MTSTNKTTHYHLSQFVDTDNPTFTGDYNADMAAIDAGIYAASQSGDGGLRPDDVLAGNAISVSENGGKVTISYVGGGEAGGLSAVAHGNTLKGDGTTLSPLDVADDYRNGLVTDDELASYATTESLSNYALKSEIPDTSQLATKTEVAGKLSSIAVGTNLTGDGTTGNPVALANTVALKTDVTSAIAAEAAEREKQDGLLKDSISAKIGPSNIKAGTNITVSQSGNDVTINSTAGGGGGNAKGKLVFCGWVSPRADTITARQNVTGIFSTPPTLTDGSFPMFNAATSNSGVTIQQQNLNHFVYQTDSNISYVDNDYIDTSVFEHDAEYNYYSHKSLPLKQGHMFKMEVHLQYFARGMANSFAVLKAMRYSADPATSSTTGKLLCYQRTPIDILTEGGTGSTYATIININDEKVFDISDTYKFVGMALQYCTGTSAASNVAYGMVMQGLQVLVYCLD